MPQAKLHNRLKLMQGSSASMAGWQRLLGADFDEARPLLVKVTGECVSTYPCPISGVSLLVREKPDGDGYIAFATGEDAGWDDEDLDLSWNDVQVWTLDKSLLSPGGEKSGGSGDDISISALKAHLDARLDTLGKDFAETKAENERLKADLSKVLSGVARKVEPEFFQWIFVVLGTGSVSAASRKLGVSNSSLDAKLKAYAARGPVYKMLHDMVTIRRKLGRKSVEHFNELFAEHQPAEACREESLLRDLLDGLESLDASNWELARNELIDLVKEAFL